MQAELSKQLTALSSQVVHLQSEIMRRGQLSGQLQEQLQAEPLVSPINGHVSMPDAMAGKAIQLQTTAPDVLHGADSTASSSSQEATSGLETTASPSNAAGPAHAAETTDAARQPGVSLLQLLQADAYCLGALLK